MPDILEVELRISEGNAEVVIGKTKQKLEDFVQTAEKAQPEIKFKIPNQNYIDLDKLEQRAESTRNAFQDIAKTRLDAGLTTNLTKELTKAAERSKLVTQEIAGIRRELANPNNSKTAITKLIGELEVAQKEADRLERKITSVKASAAAPVPAGLFSPDAKQAKFQKQQLSYQINDIATMAAMGANPTQIFASQAGQIGQIFDPKQVAAVTAAYAGLALTVAAGAAAIGAAYLVTKNIRAEAERRLKVEEQIAGAINNQIISQREGLKNFAELQRQIEFSRMFTAALQTDTREDLINKRANLQQRLNLTRQTLPTIENGKVVEKTNQDFELIKSQILEVNAQIITLQQNTTKTANDAFNERWESWKRSQESAEKAQERAIAAQEKFNKSVEDGKKKVDELGKTYNSVFDDLYQKSNQNNPFVKVFSEGDEALKKMRENLKGLSPELRAVAEQMQINQNNLARFGTRIDNNLDAFDLRMRARSLREPQQESEEDRRKRIDDAAQRSVNAGNFFAGGVFGNYGSFLANKAGGFDKLTDAQKRDIFEARSFGNLGFIGNVQNSTFNDLNSNSLLTSLANDRVRGGQNENLSLNERLKKQLDIIYSGVSTEDEKAIAERKLLSISSSVDPSQISASLRERLAVANENEAARKSNYEAKALKLQQDNVDASKAVAKETAALRKVVEEKGLSGLIEIIDKSNGAATVKEKPGKAANNDSVKSYYEQYEEQ